jgi:ATP-binding cassette subfamily F protein uup
MAAHDPTDFTGLQELSEKESAIDEESGSLEERWLELSELVG